MESSGVCTSNAVALMTTGRGSHASGVIRVSNRVRGGRGSVSYKVTVVNQPDLSMEETPALDLICMTDLCTVLGRVPFSSLGTK